MTDTPSTQSEETKGSIRGFAVAVACVVAIFAYFTYQRNFVWDSNASLWKDITDKAERVRVIDPETGKESPRFDRARMYNNLGLELYYLGSKLSNNRTLLRKSESALQLARAQKDKSADDMAKMKQLEANIEKLRQGVVARSVALLKAVPESFIPKLVEARVSVYSSDWPAYLPAEMCYHRALFHNPSYYMGWLNLGLISWLESRNETLSPDEVRKLREEAAACFRNATNIMPSFEKSSLYGAKVLNQLGRYEESMTAARRGYLFHSPAMGVDFMLEEISLSMEGAIYLGKEKEAEYWLVRLATAKAPESKLGKYYANLAELAYKQDRKDMAERIIAKGVETLGDENGELEKLQKKYGTTNQK